VTVVIAIVLALAVGLLVLLGLVRRAMIAYDPAPVVGLPVLGAAGPGVDSDRLELLSWNIGYAGLGRESDFVVDGGRHLRTKSRSLVERNLEAIVARVREDEPDVVLLQELARAGYITHGVDVLGRLQEALDGYQLAFAETLRVTGLPLVGNLEVGQGTFARQGISAAVRHALTSPATLLGMRVQNFHAVEARLRSTGPGASWVVFNVHMPAFDGGSLRRQQLGEVLRLLEAEYEKGRYVVAGGDWNLRLVSTAFPHTTEERHKFWVRDLPDDVTPSGWSWAVDARVPTNRTLEQPYRPGVNFTSVIDGFLVSPNVEILGAETLDLEFANSDHNPVRVQLQGREPPAPSAA
jgi:endonuclease/exonuclease/phosphatase family metal-dependent hydrolase